METACVQGSRNSRQYHIPKKSMTLNNPVFRSKSLLRIRISFLLKNIFESIVLIFSESLLLLLTIHSCDILSVFVPITNIDCLQYNINHAMFLNMENYGFCVQRSLKNVQYLSFELSKIIFVLFSYTNNMKTFIYNILYRRTLNSLYKKFPCELSWHNKETNKLLISITTLAQYILLRKVERSIFYYHYLNVFPTATIQARLDGRQLVPPRAKNTEQLFNEVS